MAVYTQLAQDVVATLIDETYDVGVFDSAKGIAEGVENSNYLITTKAQERYILTLFEKRVKAADLPFFMGLMAHLHAKGIACPLPVTRRDGKVIGEVAGKQAVMVTFLDGRNNVAIGEAQVAAVGTMVARMHEAGKDFAGARVNDLSMTGYELLFIKCGSRLNEIEPGLAVEVAGEIAYLNRHWPKELPAGVVHADVFPDNVFFDGEHITGVIDFYFACDDMYAYDLAIVMNAWCFDGQKEFNAGKAALLMREYQKVRRLSATEIAAFGVLARAAALRFLLTRAHDVLFHDANAVVTPHDPMEYVRKLRFHQHVASAKEYGL